MILCLRNGFDRCTKIVEKESNSLIVGDIFCVTTAKRLIGGWVSLFQKLKLSSLTPTQKDHTYLNKPAPFSCRFF